jgi:hypothetical protein
MIENLIKNKRYLVYQNDWHFNTGQDKLYIRTVKTFRANLKEIIGQSIIFNAYISKNMVKYERNSKHSIPLNWIVKCQTLDEITGKKIPLPIELVEIIDSYL